MAMSAAGFPFIRPIMLYICAPSSASGHVFQADHGAVLVGADHDIPELFFRLQAALRANAVGKLLSGRTGSTPIWPAGFNGILGLDRVENLRHGDAQLANWSGRTQKRIAYWPAPKICTWPIPGTRVMGSLMLT